MRELLTGDQGLKILDEKTAKDALLIELTKRLRRILNAVSAQGSDASLWPVRHETLEEAHAYQALRWLHDLIESDSDEALQKILNQSNGSI